ncbi:MAG: hypothetical protein IT258_10270 [Saprospiraceae bacterium]|nr:hypothetical protein [Saprospiraceae bacterium]
MKTQDIEELINEQPFEMLTEAERANVLAHMTEWEYQQAYQLLQRSKAAMKRSPKPDPAIRERLMGALRQQPKTEAKPPAKTGLLVRMAQYRLPVWQVAAGLAMLLVAHFAQQKTPQEVVRTETVYVNNTDTIYKEIAIPVAEQPAKINAKRVNVKPRLASQPKPSTMDAVAFADSSSRQSGALPDTMPGFRLTVQQANGRSANEMQELWQLLGDVY